MVRLVDPPAKEEAAWKRWLKKRPPAIRAVAEKFDPWSLYRMKSTGQRVTVYSFSEGESGVTLTVDISGQFNRTLFERQVFGVDPDDLEPCELPGPNEILGAMLSPAEVGASMDALKVMVRPDLFVMGADGKAQRKS